MMDWIAVIRERYRRNLCFQGEKLKNEYIICSESKEKQEALLRGG